MLHFLRSSPDPEVKSLRVVTGIRTGDGTHYLVLNRLPPHYAKPPTFVVRLTDERMEVRGEGAMLYRAYALQEFTPKELVYLSGLCPGKPHAPFFNFSYPNVLKRMGKVIQCLDDAALRQLVGTRDWKLVGGTN